MAGVLIALIIGGTVCFGLYMAVAAERLKRGRRAGTDTETAATDIAVLQLEIADLRRDLAELAERMDFGERLLAKQRDRERLGPSR